MARELPAVSKMYDLIKWLLPQIAKLPRSHKFTLGDRITNLALDTLELLIQAVYTRNKRNLLSEANLNLEKMRYMIRICYDLDLLGLRKYEYVSKEINEVGKQIVASQIRNLGYEFLKCDKMKTYNHLFEQICSFENLLSAAKKAQKGKRSKQDVAMFNFRLEHELLKLQEELLNGTYQPGEYYEFYIFEPKKRMISAAPYRDRVVHHALCNVIEPIFDKSFIYDTYACRKGKGTHRAVERFTQFCRKNKYVLKCDIKKYFPSIDHEILYELICHKIRDRRTLWLIKLIIDSSNEQERVLEYFENDDLLTPLERRKAFP